MARILIAGTGALGSVFGVLLRRAGHEVTLLGRAVHLHEVSRTGLHIDGIWGEHRALGFQVATDAATLGEVFDAILLTVKSYDTGSVARAVAPRLAPDGVCISFQNGLGNAETVAEVVGPERVLAARVIFGAEVIAPGRARVTVFADPVLVGTWPTGTQTGAPIARKWVRELAAAGVPTEFTDDIAAALWGKVLYSAALNPLGALMGVHYGALGEDPNTRAIMDAAIAEAFSVAMAERVALPWTTAAEYRDVFYGRLLPSTYHHRSSMLQDLERRRLTEVDAITGAVWRRGCARGILTPVNELLTRLVHAREVLGGERAP